jgi:hypothetical protein
MMHFLSEDEKLVVTEDARVNYNMPEYVEFFKEAAVGTTTSTGTRNIDQAPNCKI